MKGYVFGMFLMVSSGLDLNPRTISYTFWGCGASSASLQLCTISALNAIEDTSIFQMQVEGNVISVSDIVVNFLFASYKRSCQ